MTITWLIFHAFLSGLFGFTFIEILCRPTDIFGWYPRLFRKVLFGSPEPRKFEDMKWWQLYLYKPLAGCGICFAGWTAITDYFVGIPNVVFFVAGAIFVAWFLDEIQEKVFKKCEK